MRNLNAKAIGRRSMLRAAVGAFGASFWCDEALDAALQNTRTNSKPSDLKITDMRMAAVGGGLIRLDTNQGIYGVGENRQGASKMYPLMLKRLVVGENPCNVDKIFRKIKQFGGNARQGGGVSGVEMALWDLAGKAYNVPVYQMLGGKFRDQIRCYADTMESPDPRVLAERMKRRVEEGFTWVKSDMGIGLLAKVPDALTYPADQTLSLGDQKAHPFTGINITDKGIAVMVDYIAKVRELIGMQVPLSIDHFGHMGVNSFIRLGRALEKYNIAWMEDMIPWQMTDLLKTITEAIEVPTCTGEDVYLVDNFEPLCRDHAVDIIHPDVAVTGGILETKKIGDMAQKYGIPMAIHNNNSPVNAMASVHVAAATENFLVLEHHYVDHPEWNDIIDGVNKPICSKGFIPVPDGPGLGFTLNEEAIKKQLRQPGYFESTPQWDGDPKEQINYRLWA